MNFYQKCKARVIVLLILSQNLLCTWSLNKTRMLWQSLYISRATLLPATRSNIWISMFCSYFNAQQHIRTHTARTTQCGFREATACTCLLCNLLLSQQAYWPLAVLGPIAGINTLDRSAQSYLWINCRVEDEPLGDLRRMSVESWIKPACLGWLKIIQSYCNFLGISTEKNKNI